MATKKPKSSKTTTTKSKTTKPKTAAKTASKPVSEAPKTAKVEKKTEEVTSAKKSCFSGFFAKKYEAKESILTIFKDHKFYGALLGEILGTAFITLLISSLSLMGVANIGMLAFAVVAIYIAVYAFSGACLNPLIAVGMMASRRMSVIRGVMYILVEILGAWIGWLIFSSFHLAGGETAYSLPAMATVAEGKFWVTAMIELLGAVIIAFFYARALKYKRSVFTFGAIVAGGIALAFVIAYVVSAAFLFSGMANNFVMNPAIALMYQIFPTAGENFGEIMGGICQALSIYALLPMIGGVCGFYLSDFTAKLSGDEQ